MRILVFDQSSPVHPVSESRGGGRYLERDKGRTNKLMEIFVSNIRFTIYWYYYHDIFAKYVSLLEIMYAQIWTGRSIKLSYVIMHSSSRYRGDFTGDYLHIWLGLVMELQSLTGRLQLQSHCNTQFSGRSFLNTRMIVLLLLLYVCVSCSSFPPPLICKWGGQETKPRGLKDFFFFNRLLNILAKFSFDILGINAQN